MPDRVTKLTFDRFRRPQPWMALPSRNERITYTLRPGDQLLLDPLLRGYIIANSDYPPSFLAWDGRIAELPILDGGVMEAPASTQIETPETLTKPQTFPEAAKKLVIKLDEPPAESLASAPAEPGASPVASGPSTPLADLEFQRLPGKDGFSFIEVALADGEPIYIMESKCIWTKYPREVPGQTSTMSKALGLLASKAKALWASARGAQPPST